MQKIQHSHLFYKKTKLSKFSSDFEKRRKSMFLKVQLSTDINDNIDHENEYIRKYHRTFVKKLKKKNTWNCYQPFIIMIP